MTPRLDRITMGRVATSFLLTLFAAYFLVTMEWLFFITKPSFFTAATGWEVFEALSVVGFLVFIVSSIVWAVVASVIVSICLILPPWRNNTVGRLLNKVLLLPPALLLSIAAILLLDNFSNTLVGYGIAKTAGLFRTLYLLAWVLIFWRIFVKLIPLDASTLLANHPRLPALAAGLVAVSLIGSASGILSGRQDESDMGMGMDIAASDRVPRAQRPNILFFATDGVSADLLSLYGNKHKTSPNLEALAEHALVAENAFTNSERTTGSVISMLAGKYPATTKVLFPPHVLQGNQAYQHLPGILRRLGYSTFQESIRYYGDANDLNLRGGFDLANGTQDPQWLPTPLRHLQYASLFANKTTERIGQRIKHILFMEDMLDVYAVVKNDGYVKVFGLSDRSRVDRTVSFIKNNENPFFIHLHLMDSHCCSFKPKEKVFALGKFPGKYMAKRGLLEDLVKESDDYFGEVVAALRASGKLDNTIIVYSSDHTEYWGFRRPVPLIFIFPNGDHAGRIAENTQLLDVAPTILEYLDIEAPIWMEGQSLLSGSRDSNRPIFGITRLERAHFKTQVNHQLSRIVGAGPPNYGLKIMGLVVCNNWYMHDIKEDTTQSGAIRKYVGSCDAAAAPTEDEAKQLMQEHLLSRGFLGS